MLPGILFFTAGFSIVLSENLRAENSADFSSDLTADLTSDLRTFCAEQNRTVTGISTLLLAARRCGYTRSAQSGILWQTDILGSSAVMPAHARYNGSPPDMLKSAGRLSQIREEIQSVKAGALISRGLLTGSFFFMGWPGQKWNEPESRHGGAGASLYFRILTEKFYRWTILGGGGYGYSAGRIRGSMHIPAGSWVTGNPGFSGDTASSWNTHAVYNEILIGKNVLLVNFYAGLSGGIMPSAAATSVTGTSQGIAMSASAHTRSIENFFIIRCGWELILGKAQIVMEGARDWKSGALSAVWGIKFNG